MSQDQSDPCLRSSCLSFPINCFPFTQIIVAKKSSDNVLRETEVFTDQKVAYSGTSQETQVVCQPTKRPDSFVNSQSVTRVDFDHKLKASLEKAANRMTENIPEILMLDTP